MLSPVGTVLQLVLALVALVVVVLVRVLVVVIMACLVVLGQAVVVVWEDQPEDQPWLDSGTQPFVQQKRGILVPAGPFVLARLVSDHTRGETPQWLQQLWLHHQ